MSSDTSPESRQITLSIKHSSSDTLSLSVDLSHTVLSLKETLSSKISVEPERIRLIYSGRVLKDPEPLSVYGLKDGHTLHLVKGAPKGGAGSGAASRPTEQTRSTSNTTPADTQPASQPQSQQPPPIPTLENIFSGGAAGLGGLGQAGGGGMLDPEMIGRALNNPGLMQAVSQQLQNPQYLQSMLNSNPQFSQMMTPEMRRATEAMMQDPNMMANLMGMLSGQAGRQPGTGNTGGTDRSTGNTGNTGNTGASPFGAGGLDSEALSQFMQAMSGAGGAPGTTPSNPADNRPAEERYESQLRQLNEMGFWDPQKNIRALQLTGGNVNAAIEWLLSQP